MRVLLVSGSFPPVKCGVGDYTSLLAEELARRGDAAVAVLTGRGCGAPAAGSGVELLGAVDGWGVREAGGVLEAVRSWHPDIVHIQYPTRGYGRGKLPLLLPYLLTRSGYAVVQTWHEPLDWLHALRYLPCALTRDVLVTVESDYRPLVPGWLWRILRDRKRLVSIPLGSMIPVARLSAAEVGEVRQRYAAGGAGLIAYFGFAVPSKGIEHIFEVADPQRDRIVLLCELDRRDAYQRMIAGLVDSPRWRDRAFVTGHLDGQAVARVLAAADAAVFPFNSGMTARNTSVLAARAQGTFVLTTGEGGYDPGQHLYRARPGELEEMRQALERYRGTRPPDGCRPLVAWSAVAEQHFELYRRICAERSAR